MRKSVKLDTLNSTHSTICRNKNLNKIACNDFRTIRKDWKQSYRAIVSVNNWIAARTADPVIYCTLALAQTVARRVLTAYRVTVVLWWGGGAQPLLRVATRHRQTDRY